METNIPFSNVIDFAAHQGFLIKFSDQEYTNLPFTVFPSPIPKSCFLEVLKIQPHINKLMYLISQDVEFLSESLKSVIEADDFTKKLFMIFKEVLLAENKASYQLGILRSDYMFDCSQQTSQNFSYSSKQIEVNTIAVGFGGLGGDVIRSIHCRSLKEFNRSNDIEFLPENLSKIEIAKGLFDGWKAYNNSKAIILFLVLQNEANIFDQRALEYSIYSINENVPVRRKHFNDIIDQGRTDDNGKLFVDNEEVAVVYFRSCYSPDHYPTPEHWKARLLIENSRAIKCPDVALQLAGCKKIQEILARPGVVEKFIKDPEIAAELRRTYAGLYRLDMTKEGDEAVKRALSNPENYVMKPQREGGGNNVYGPDIARRLNQIGSSPERSTYILMDLVRPKSHKNFSVVKGKVTEADFISELGVFGVYLAKNGEMLTNKTAGHLLRSKPDTANEGGVVVGVASIDSPLLQ